MAITSRTITRIRDQLITCRQGMLLGSSQKTIHTALTRHTRNTAVSVAAHPAALNIERIRPPIPPPDLAAGFFLPASFFSAAFPAGFASLMVVHAPGAILAA